MLISIMLTINQVNINLVYFNPDVNFKLVNFNPDVDFNLVDFNLVNFNLQLSTCDIPNPRHPSVFHTPPLPHLPPSSISFNLFRTACPSSGVDCATTERLPRQFREGEDSRERDYQSRHTASRRPAIKTFRRPPRRLKNFHRLGRIARFCRRIKP